MAPTKSALITGVTGQDGGHLAPLLHEKGYEVFGTVRYCSNQKKERFQAEFPYVTLIEADLLKPSSIIQAVDAADPDEFYNLAAVTDIGYSFRNPAVTLDTTARGVQNCLEAIRLTGRSDKTRVFQASSSEMFGGLDADQPGPGYDEGSLFHPRSPYGVAKLCGHWLAKNYRESYGFFTSCGILFNHTGERRGAEFVSRKITRAVARIHLGLQDHISLGNLWPKRDWGYAGDYARGMWQMLQYDEPEDFVLATGVAHSIEDFLKLAFQAIGIDDWSAYVEPCQALVRPTETDILLGNPAKAESVLGWKREVDFLSLVHRMVQHDIAEQASECMVLP